MMDKVKVGVEKKVKVEIKAAEKSSDRDHSQGATNRSVGVRGSQGATSRKADSINIKKVEMSSDDSQSDSDNDENDDEVSQKNEQNIDNTSIQDTIESVSAHNRSIKSMSDIPIQNDENFEQKAAEATTLGNEPKITLAQPPKPKFKQKGSMIDTLTEFKNARMKLIDEQTSMEIKMTESQEQISQELKEARIKRKEEMKRQLEEFAKAQLAKYNEALSKTTTQPTKELAESKDSKEPLEEEVKDKALEIPTPTLAGEMVNSVEDDTVVTIPLVSVVVKTNESFEPQIIKAETSLNTDRPKPSFNLVSTGLYVRQNELKKVYDNQTGMLISLNEKIALINQQRRRRLPPITSTATGGERKH